MNENINMTDDQYKDYVEKKAKKSPIFKDVLLAFISGGVICIIGQIIMNIFLYYNVEKDSATAFTSIILIFIGAFLTSINVYSTIGKYCGAGSAIPITGFSNSIVSPAIEFKTEGRILGLGANMFKIAGPVLVYGISTSVVVGFIYWIIKLF